jgi:beta-lactamase regulating signal transducer with metallopeptidase domain
MLWWLAQNTVMAAALAAGVALLCRLGRFSPVVRHALWLIVLVKLLTPPGVHWPWALPNCARHLLPQAAVVAEPSPPPDRLLPDGDVLGMGLLLEGAFPAQDVPLPLGAEETGPELFLPDQPSETAVPGWPSALASAGLHLWLAGALAVAAVQLVRIVRFRRKVAHGRRAPRCLVRQLDDLVAKLGVRRPALLVVPDLGSPLLWSLGRPKLLWPAALLEGLPVPCRRSVLAHELAHLRRRDHWVGWLLLAAGCVWWWNPLFWYVRRQLRQNAELACDAWVVSLLPEDRRAYAEALIEVSQQISGAAAPVPALGMSRGPRQTFERRLTMIMRERVPCRVPSWGCVALGVLTLAALPGWSLGQKEDPPTTVTVQEVKPLAVEVKLQDVLVENVDVPLQNVLVELVPSAQQAAGGDREQKLQELERKLDALLKEVKALRAGAAAKSSQPAANLLRYRATQVAQPHQPMRVQVEPLLTKQPVLGLTTVRARGSELTLSRATYKLPRAKADTLAAFLQDNVKAAVIEIKVEGDSLTVTTTPEAQKAIGGLIALIQASSADKAPATKSSSQAPVPAADRAVEGAYRYLLRTTEEKPHLHFRLEKSDAKPVLPQRFLKKVEEKDDQPNH